jgi:aspartokinase-like uncharacterized kinase
MRVIKLGGSLLDAGTLSRCLDRIDSHYANNTVIVTGGGCFAEQVRLAQQQWLFDDDTAHRMAILAMQQMALLFKGLKQTYTIAHSVSAIPALLAAKPHTPVIWSPDIEELYRASIACTWHITSDSLAAWLANTLLANELILVKSASVDKTLTVQELVLLGIVDKAFNDFISASRFSLSIVNSTHF